MITDRIDTEQAQQQLHLFSWPGKTTPVSGLFNIPGATDVRSLRPFDQQLETVD